MKIKDFLQNATSYELKSPLAEEEPSRVSYFDPQHIKSAFSNIFQKKQEEPATTYPTLEQTEEEMTRKGLIKSTDESGKVIWMTQEARDGMEEKVGEGGPEQPNIVERVVDEFQDIFTPPSYATEEIAGAIGGAFDGELGKEAYEVLKGENARLDPNAENKNRDGSIDRGLFQINSNTFDDFMRRKGDLLRESGITSFEDMYDPVKNARMARIIYDEQGWRAWYGAPDYLREG